MKKIYDKFLSLLLCLAMAFGVLWGVFPARAETEISSVAVSVTSPAAGASPVFRATAADPAYTVKRVQWFSNGKELQAIDQFAAGQSYEVRIRLAAAGGKTFAQGASGTINGEPCSAKVAEPDTELELTHQWSIASEGISAVAVTGLTIPTADNVPDKAIAVAHDTYQIQEVSWARTDQKPMDEKFVGGSEYRLRIVLAAQTGRSFADAVSGTIDGRAASCTVLSKASVALEAVYTVVGKVSITQVAITDLTVPEKNAAPDIAVSTEPGAMYTVEQVVWRGWKTTQGSGSYMTLTQSDTFLAGYSYQAAFLLKANDGAEFLLDEQGAPKVTATVNGAVAYSGTAASGKDPSEYVLVGIDYAIKSDKKPITQVAVTDVTVPVVGQKPTQTGKVPEAALYTIDQVIWQYWSIGSSEPVTMGGRDTFMAASDYQVTVILKANDDAEFSLGQNDSVDVTATINGNPTNPPAAVKEQDAAQYISISYYFRTADKVVKEVSVLGLDEPVQGKLPDFKIETPVNSGYAVEEVIWQWRDAQTPGAKFSKMANSDAFGYGKEYRICVTLTAKENIEFSVDGSGQTQVTAKFNGEAAGPAQLVDKRPANSCIQVTCDYLLESDVKTVERVSVEKLDIPMAGSKPDMEAEIAASAKYTVKEVSWERMTGDSFTKLNRNDSFRAGESYRVTVLLQAGENEEFAVSTQGKIQVSASLNGGSVLPSEVSGREPKNYISIAREYTIYTVIEGDGARWTPEKDTLRFRFSGDTGNFSGIAVDGTAVKNNFYTVSQGSVVIELDKWYLSTLSNGKHQLTVLYDNGAASTEFEISNDGSVIPTQGEQSGNGSGIWILILCLTVAVLCGAAALSIFLRKKGWL